ncbi:flagellar export protein FliJ [Bacillus chungangensis]|uniref:Flagellar FliJ protein n=1 Tax=Bacillus chungangensis TaxID=587633 RepID=A0ABT9WR97_9BACI|nr:flagellar export protein FliJ [Bacillus chungangensis]MDQ0175821.1 flagellar FliJ protein [Bacillus chungangensis]
MSHHYRFEKILALKEREKDEALLLYEKAVKNFEEAAEKLYSLLKKKETLEVFQTNKLNGGFSIHEIRHYQQFITNLEETINHYQEIVISARNSMNWYKQKLQEKNIEVKKYEKMKVKNTEKWIQVLRSRENKALDEISTLQFFNRNGS